jgi:hypothetical protein
MIVVWPVLLHVGLPWAVLRVLYTRIPALQELGLVLSRLELFALWYELSYYQL